MTLAEALDRPQLATLSGRPFLTDGGLELVLIFQEGIDLPDMSAFPLLETAEGRGRLDAYTRPYLDIARRHGVGYVHETPTWRGSWGWTAQMGYSMARTAELNRLAVGIGHTLAHRNRDIEIVVSGNVGPRGDGYAPETLMTADEAERYHAHQIGAFAEARAALVTALTITHAGEGAGIALAARAVGLPVVISFTVETDGRLPSGQPLGAAIEEVDGRTGGYPASYGINCAHPTHFAPALRQGGAWRDRIGMVRANASKKSHAELDCSETLDDGDPDELGQDYAELRALLPAMTVLGGCCGTDHRHVGRIAGACLG